MEERKARRVVAKDFKKLAALEEISWRKKI